MDWKFPPMRPDRPKMPSRQVSMALLPRVFTFSKAPIIFLIGDRHACMSKNQSCLPLKKPFRTTGYFRHWQMRASIWAPLRRVNTSAVVPQPRQPYAVVLLQPTELRPK